MGRVLSVVFFTKNARGNLVEKSKFLKWIDKWILLKDNIISFIKYFIKEK